MGRLREPEHGPRHRGTLVCVVIKAKNLQNRRPIGKQDPYAELTIEGTTQRTRPDRRGGQHPLWDEQLHFELFDDLHGMAALSGRDFAEGRSLHVACFASDRSSHEALGEGRLPLETALRQGECDKWIPLSNRGRYAGEVYVELTFYSSDPPPPLPARTPPSSRQPRSSSTPGNDGPQTLHPSASRSVSSVYTPPYAPRTFTPSPRSCTPMRGEPQLPQRSVSHGYASMSQDKLPHSFSDLSTWYSPDPAAPGHAVHRPLPSPAPSAPDAQDESIVDWGVQSPGWRRPVPPTPADTSLQSNPDESLDSMYLQRAVASPAPLGNGAPPAPPLPARAPGYATPSEDPSSPPSFARNVHASTPQMTAQEAIYGTSSPLPVGTHSRPLPPVGAHAPAARRPLPSPVSASPGPYSTPRPADLSRDSAHLSTERLAALSPGAAPSPTQAHFAHPPPALGSGPRAASPAFNGVSRSISPALSGVPRAASPALGSVPRAASPSFAGMRQSASPAPGGVPRAVSPASGGIPRAASPAAMHLPRPVSPGAPHVAPPSGGAVPDTINPHASRPGVMHKWS